MKTKSQNKPKAVPADKTLAGKKSFFKSPLMIPAGIFLALTVIFYWPVLTGQGFLWNDFLEQNFVYRLFAAVSLKQGVMPFWNPYVFSGMPFFADVQAAVLYPLNFIMTLFASSDWLSPALCEYQIIFHVALAGFFMYLLAREFGVNKSGAVISGITFMFCGFFTTHIFHVNLVQTAAWFPLVIFLFKRTIDKSSLLYMALTAITLCVMFLCGYPQLMVHIYYWLAAFYIFGLIVRIRGKTALLSEVKRGILFVALVALSIGMSSVQLMPTQELAKNSVRPKLEFNESCEGSFRPYRFITLLAPNYLGQPQKTQYWGISGDDVRGGIHSYWETAIYVGVIPLTLAILAAFFARTPLTVFLSIMGIISVMLAMGNSFFLYGLAFKFLPALNSFRIPGRFAYLFSVSVALLAGTGVTWLCRNDIYNKDKMRKRLEKILIACTGLFLVWGVLYAAGMFKTGITEFMTSSGNFGTNSSQIASFVEQKIYPEAVKGIWIFVLLFATGVAVVIARLRGKISAKITVGILAAATIIDFLIFGFSFAAGNTDPSAMYQKSDAITQLQGMQMQEFFRINSRDSNHGTDDLGGPDMVFRKNQGSVHRLFLMEGYNPLRLKRQLVNRKQQTLDILNVKYGIVVDESRGSMGLGYNQTYLPRCRMVYKYAVEPDENNIQPLMYNPAFDYRNSVVLEEKPAINIDSGAVQTSDCRITKYSLNAIDMTVSTPKNGLLVLSEIHYPSWKAKVDGKPVPLYRADYALRAIPVEKGEHTVSCYFDTGVFTKGLFLSIVSIVITLVCAGIGLGCWFAARRKPV